MVPLFKSVISSKVGLIYMYAVKLLNCVPPALGGLFWNKKAFPKNAVHYVVN